MTIDKSSWHYRAYAITYSGERWNIPETTSLCDYFGRLFFLGILAQVVFIPLRFLVLVLGCCFGYRPEDYWGNCLLGNTSRGFWTAIPAWQEITFKIHGKNQPIIADFWRTFALVVVPNVLLTFFLMVGFCGIIISLTAVYQMLGKENFYIGMCWLGLGFVGLCVAGLVYGRYKRRGWMYETVALVSARIRAWKEGACPGVTFTDKS